MNAIDIFPWDDNFNTGLPTVDEQHRKLVQLLNNLASHVAFNANVPELDQLFDELADYTVYHFETEEALMLEYGYVADDDAHQRPASRSGSRTAAPTVSTSCRRCCRKA